LALCANPIEPQARHYNRKWLAGIGLRRARRSDAFVSFAHFVVPNRFHFPFARAASWVDNLRA